MELIYFVHYSDIAQNMTVSEGISNPIDVYSVSVFPKWFLLHDQKPKWYLIGLGIWGASKQKRTFSRNSFSAHKGGNFE